jgi:hypothetical protein
VSKFLLKKKQSGRLFLSLIYRTHFNVSKSIASGAPPSSLVNANFSTSLARHHGSEGGCRSWFLAKP